MKSIILTFSKIDSNNSFLSIINRSLQCITYQLILLLALLIASVYGIKHIFPIYYCMEFSYLPLPCSCAIEVVRQGRVLYWRLVSACQSLLHRFLCSSWRIWPPGWHWNHYTSHTQSVVQQSRCWEAIHPSFFNHSTTLILIRLWSRLQARKVPAPTRKCWRRTR